MVTRLPTRLTSDFWTWFISFLDPADAAEMAQFRALTSNLLKKHGFKQKDRGTEEQEEED